MAPRVTTATNLCSETTPQYLAMFVFGNLGGFNSGGGKDLASKVTRAPGVVVRRTPVFFVRRTKEAAYPTKALQGRKLIRNNHDNQPGRGLQMLSTQRHHCRITVSHLSSTTLQATRSEEIEEKSIINSMSTAW